jgi:hypothetical protein
VDGLKPGEDATFDGRVLGYPLHSIQNLPQRSYQVAGALASV